MFGRRRTPCAVKRVPARRRISKRFPGLRLDRSDGALFDFEQPCAGVDGTQGAGLRPQGSGKIILTTVAAVGIQDDLA
jgi:hypothetical protein